MCSPAAGRSSDVKMTQTGRVTAALLLLLHSFESYSGHILSGLGRIFLGSCLDRQSVPLDLGIADLISADPFGQPTRDDVVDHLVALNTVSARISAENPLVNIYALRVSIGRACGSFRGSGGDKCDHVATRRILKVSDHMLAIGTRYLVSVQRQN